MEEDRTEEGEAAATAAAGGLLFAGAPVATAAAPDKSQAWMITFADLVALLLTFFVLLFSMSRIETTDWQNLKDSLSTSLNSVHEDKIAVPSKTLDLERSQAEPGANLDYLRSLLRDQLAGNPVLARAVLTRERELLVISLPSDLLFAPGSVRPAKTAVDSLQAICGVLRSLENRIEVAGHADPTPPGTDWNSNWSLSLARALSFAALLQTDCYRGEIAALGRGQGLYDELPASLPTAERRARARRVDIIIHESAASR